jgi:hypothetical protein
MGLMVTSNKSQKRQINWDRVFGGIGSVTFGAQLLSILILIAAGLVFLLMITGIWNIALANFDILIFFLLIAGGFSFLIFIWLLGFFLRFHGRIQKFIIGKGLGHIDAGEAASKTILTLFAVVVLFVLVAAVYGYYLIWKYFLDPWSVGFLTSWGLAGILLYEYGLLIVWLAFGCIIITFVMQLLSAAINRYVDRLVSGIKEAP